MRNINDLKEKYEPYHSVIDLPSDRRLFQKSRHNIDLENYATRLLAALRPRDGQNMLKQLAADVAYDAADIRSNFNAIHEWIDQSYHPYGAISALQVLAAGAYLNQPGGRKIPGASYKIGNGRWGGADADEYVERFLKAVQVREGDTTLRQLVLDINRDVHILRQDFAGKSTGFESSWQMYGILDVLHAVVGRTANQFEVSGAGGPTPPQVKPAPLSKALAL